MKISMLSLILCASVATAAKVPNWTVSYWENGSCKGDPNQEGDEKAYGCTQFDETTKSVKAGPNTGGWTTTFYTQADCKDGDGGLPITNDLCVGSGVYKGYDEFKAYRVSSMLCFIYIMNNLLINYKLPGH